MRRKKLLALAATLIVCLLFYLLALESYCDQGEKFALGICSITRILPW
ncbi:PhoP/PhoQ regulator MgrB [Serratia fonticola]|nr:PhoP/PhoQ regulator MgrB [Serratia fonticola]MBP0999857.1 PhoP/PhoQ regulator MgrB [Serratia fonticola]MBP1004316.1 PhoP/PhoQ regulator MgrB [Serratia fonticola]MBP1015027.1 PhoP/PhoQ regulator MgrB [Serratia fonticola]MBP1017238.1 PhoP/PhoQ regulator MgrB [Serratia fonticola]NYA45807.1 PhoP/PhoQ regulator MgrB [Serratia fonticola]